MIGELSKNSIERIVVDKREYQGNISLLHNLVEWLIDLADLLNLYNRFVMYDCTYLYSSKQ